MKQRTMLYLFTLSAVIVSATVYAGETKPEIQIAAESTTGSLKDMELMTIRLFFSLTVMYMEESAVMKIIPVLLQALAMQDLLRLRQKLVKQQIS